jgi:Leucine-rich repeat (LRR) protein
MQGHAHATHRLCDPGCAVQVLFLPDTVGALHKVEKLRMGQNQMRYLPETLGRCTSLTLLSLTCNQLWTIPDSFASCTNVTALHISSNRFRQVTSSKYAIACRRSR